jgi:hypothetical protein
MTVSEK